MEKVLLFFNNGFNCRYIVGILNIWGKNVNMVRFLVNCF